MAEVGSDAQFLMQELESKKGIPFVQGATYEAWSPFDSHKAALKLATPFDMI